MRNHIDHSPDPDIRHDASGEVTVNAYTILVVHRDPDHCGLIRKMLGALGYRTVSAGDGIEALDRIHRQPAPDLVIMSAELPRMSGIDTITAIRHLSSPMRNLPIAAITAEVPLYLIRDLPSAGADTLLNRPFDMQELARTASSLLGGRLEPVSGESLRRSFGVSS